MDIANAIALAAALITIGVGFMALVRRARQVTVIMRVQDPGQPVTKKRLSFEDARRGLVLLLDDARRFGPDVVFGINRGGAIVGGYLTKQLQLSQVYTLYVNCDMPAGQRVTEHRRDCEVLDGRKVLLVDDACRKGEHMREAEAYLRRKYPKIQLRRLVLLEMRVHHPGPEGQTFRAVPVERCAFYTYDARVVLPWDPDQ